MRTLVSFYAGTLLTDLYIRIMHNRKKTNSSCIVTMGLTKVTDIFCMRNCMEEKTRVTKMEIKESSAYILQGSKNI